MPVDPYVKVMLTIIATALVAIASRNNINAFANAAPCGSSIKNPCFIESAGALGLPVRVQRID